jgi:hypothetical protein
MMGLDVRVRQFAVIFNKVGHNHKTPERLRRSGNSLGQWPTALDYLSIGTAIDRRWLPAQDNWRLRRASIEQAVEKPHPNELASSADACTPHACLPASSGHGAMRAFATCS